jgi:hypothetical protein
MSVPQLRRKRKLAMVAGAVAGLTLIDAAVLAAPSPVPVKAGPRNELAPTAGDDWFAWSRSRRGHPRLFDLYAQQTGQAAFKVNPKGTQAYPGGIDGTTLAYQLVRGRLRTRSDLRLFELAARRQRPVPAGINTPQWECCPTISGGWMLFDRGSGFSVDTQMVLLRNLTTGEQRVLDVLQNRKGILSTGQVNGNFAVWRRCNPHPRCVLFRYDLASASSTALPVPPGKIVYAPSVNEAGTVFHAQSNRGCGQAVQLVKQRVEGPPEVVASLPRGRDIVVTYAHHVQTKPPTDVVLTRIYFDVYRCKPHRWDIYSVDTTDRITIPP